MSQKNIYFANFNLTFGDGENTEGMLKHFHDVIYPALTSDLVLRSKELGYTFSDVKLIQYKEAETTKYALAGNLIKLMVYKRETSYAGGEIFKNPASLASEPYSRFVIFLENHRMVLVKNENHSPNIISFQSAVKAIIKMYVRSVNKELRRKRKNGEDVVFAQAPAVNIVDMPTNADIDAMFKKIEKITSFRMTFHPLNNEKPKLSFFDMAQNVVKGSGSKTANFTVNNPTNLSAVKEIYTEGKAYTNSEIKFLDKNGNKDKITEEGLRSTSTVNIVTELDESSDKSIIVRALENENITIKSPENTKLYEENVPTFEAILASQNNIKKIQRISHDSNLDNKDETK